MKKIFKMLLKYYDDSAYNCPKCGKPSSECNGNGNYGYICPDCQTEFETPDT